jgi:hypothetical protein
MLIKSVLKHPSWTGGVDPERAKRASGDGVVDIYPAWESINIFQKANH